MSVIERMLSVETAASTGETFFLVNVQLLLF